MWKWNTRDIVLFCAGAEFFHTLTHIFMSFSGMLPFTVFSITVTPEMNFWNIFINGGVTIGLIYWAHVLTRKN